MAAPGFRAETESVPGLEGAGAIRLIGRITYEGAPAARTEILDRIVATGDYRIVLELGDVEKIDTAGAAVLAEAVKVAQDRGKQILLCRPSESVMRIFRLAGFEEVLDRCCPTADDARRRLQG